MQTQSIDMKIRQAELALTEVTILATNIKQLSADALETAGANESLAAQLSSICELASLTGYHTDLTINNLCGSPGAMTSEEWLCSPAYNKLSQQPAVLA